MLELRNPHGTATRQDLVDMIDAVVDLISRASFQVEFTPIITPRQKESVKELVIKRLNSST